MFTERPAAKSMTMSSFGNCLSGHIVILTTRPVWSQLIHENGMFYTNLHFVYCITPGAVSFNSSSSPITLRIYPPIEAIPERHNNLRPLKFFNALNWLVWLYWIRSINTVESIVWTVPERFWSFLLRNPRLWAPSKNSAHLNMCRSYHQAQLTKERPIERSDFMLLGHSVHTVGVPLHQVVWWTQTVLATKRRRTIKTWETAFSLRATNEQKLQIN